jgi:hypothetical protein
MSTPIHRESLGITKRDALEGHRSTGTERRPRTAEWPAQDGPRPEDRDDTGELYRRYLWILLDSLQPAPLPVPSLTTQQTHVLLGARPGA